MVSLAALALIGLAAAIFLPANPEPQPGTPAEPATPTTLDPAGERA
jgi:hypothetical protein